MAREPVPDEVKTNYHAPGYLIPKPKDPRLYGHLVPAITQAVVTQGASVVMN